MWCRSLIPSTKHISFLEEGWTSFQGAIILPFTYNLVKTRRCLETWDGSQLLHLFMDGQATVSSHLGEANHSTEGIYWTGGTSRTMRTNSDYLNFFLAFPISPRQ